MQKECPFIKYFEMHGIDTAYIYGAGDIAQLLITQIQSAVRIEGILVHDKTENEFCGYKVYEFDDCVS